MSPNPRVGGHDRLPLEQGWEAASSPPGGEPADWLPAAVPGTAARVLLDAGRWHPGEPGELDAGFDAQDWWFRTTFEAAKPADGEEVVLHFGGIATASEVFLNGRSLFTSESMFLEHTVDVGSELRGTNELIVKCNALQPLLEVPRKPRARWRTKLAEGNLRWFRTALFGRAPGFAPGPAPVGPWRPVVLERRRGVAVDELELAPRLDGTTGVLAVTVRLRALAGSLPAAIEVQVGGTEAVLPIEDGVATGELSIANVEPWWPHTHGEPTLYPVRMRIGIVETGTVEIDAGRVGFRTLEPGAVYDVDRAPLALRVNGFPVFARGAAWTPIDPIGLAPSHDELRAALEQVRDGGLNILRVLGTSVYETRAFHDLCDELGLLVWQDFMFANFDYPIVDDGFRELVEREVRGVLRQLAGRPSLAVLCGNSEVEQQVGMLGLDPSLGRGALFGELLPALCREAGVDAVYVPSAPSGGELPFRSDQGVAHYFGVGGYRRGLDDARRSQVGFAAECLGFANVPDRHSLEAAGLTDVPIDDPRWKAGVARDVGADWDFDDVRDRYLAELFEVVPEELWRSDLERYLDLSREVSGEVMADVFGEWRRAGSPCQGGIVLWLRDLVPGAGWGLIDSTGAPKAAYHHLRRALAPVAVWMTDEGLGGIDVHIANDGPATLACRLRVAFYAAGEHLVESSLTELEVDPRSTVTFDVEGLLGRFVDAAWAYRFGPPGHDAVVASLERGTGDDAELLSQAFRFPVGRPAEMRDVADLGLEASVAGEGSDLSVRLTTAKLAYGVRIVTPGFDASDDAFSVEPGGVRVVRLRPRASANTLQAAYVTALNLNGRLSLV